MTVAETPITHPNKDTAFVTLLTTDSYVVGALVLGHSLHLSAPARRRVAMVTDRVSACSRSALSKLWEVEEVQELTTAGTPSALNLHALGRLDLAGTVTKLRVWQLKLEKAVFMDADMLVLEGAEMEKLFEQREVSACADVGWPDCFNSGLFVCEPSDRTFALLMDHLAAVGSFDGGDQGVLNTYFKNWHRLPFTYNLTFTGSYGYQPALNHHRSQVQCVHFIGAEKPWLAQRDASGRVVRKAGQPSEFVQLWWDLHDRCVKPMFGTVERPLFTAFYSGHGYGHSQGAPVLNKPLSPQQSPQADCDLASYRIKWSSEVEHYFAAKASAGTGKQVRKTVPTADLDDVEGGRGLRGVLAKTRL